MFRHFLIAMAVLVPSAAAGLAANLPPPVTKAPASTPTTYGPFYIFADFGAGGSTVENSLTIPGLDVQGTPKQYPTGILAGGGAGVEAQTGIGKFQAELHGSYNFAASSLGCAAAVGCMGAMKNGWLLQEMVYYSPIAAPMSFTGWQWAQGVGLYAGIGAAEKNVVVQLNDLVGGSVNNSAWFTGWDAGVKAEIPITATVKLRITYDYIGYNSRITEVGQLAFPAMFSQQKEQAIRAGLDFHL